MTVEQDRSAALLVRVWLEGGGDAFRARLTAVGTSDGDPDSGMTVAVSASPGEVVDAVRAWLQAFIGDAPQAD